MSNSTEIISPPLWCKRDFPEQVKSLESESEKCKEQIKAASARLDYIKSIFRFCNESAETLDFSNSQVMVGLAKVLEVIGWKLEPIESEPIIIRLTDDTDKIVLACVTTGNGGPDRNQLGTLVVNQTKLWQTNGAEVFSFLIYDSEKTGQMDPEIVSFAAKRSIGMLPKSAILKAAAEILLAEADPDDVRNAFLGT